MPDTQDPLGLTRAQYESRPARGRPGRDPFNTRKSVDQDQGGAILEHAIDDRNALRLALYGG